MNLQAACHQSLTSEYFKSKLKFLGAGIHVHDSIYQKLLKYYLTSGTFEPQVLAIIAQVSLFSIFIFLHGKKKKSDQEVKLNLTRALKKLCFFVVILFLCRLRFSKTVFLVRASSLGISSFTMKRKTPCVSIYSHLPFYKKSVPQASATGI